MYTAVCIGDTHLDHRAIGPDGVGRCRSLALAARLPELQWVKIGPALFMRGGAALIDEFHKRGFKVFLDLKWHDIPSTVADAVKAADDFEIEMASLHCLGEPAMLGMAQAVARNVVLVGVTVLTSMADPVGYETERMAVRAVQAGLRGVVCSGYNVAMLRARLGPDPWLVVPGIRSPDEARRDQMRVVTARQAKEAGATHLVVGRSITLAADPVRMYQMIREGIA